MRIETEHKSILGEIERQILIYTDSGMIITGVFLSENEMKRLTEEVEALDGRDVETHFKLYEPEITVQLEPEIPLSLILEGK